MLHVASSTSVFSKLEYFFFILNKKKIAWARQTNFYANVYFLGVLLPQLGPRDVRPAGLSEAHKPSRSREKEGVAEMHPVQPTQTN